MYRKKVGEFLSVLAVRDCIRIIYFDHIHASGQETKGEHYMYVNVDWKDMRSTTNIDANNYLIQYP